MYILILSELLGALSTDLKKAAYTTFIRSVVTFEVDYAET